MNSFLDLGDAHRKPVLAVSGLLIAAIAVLDWRIFPDIALGTLYFLPILFVSSILRPIQIIALGAVCSLFREIFNPISWQPGYIMRLVTWLIVFSATGIFVGEMNRNRKIILQRSREMLEQSRLREVAERGMHVLIETSPLAILTLDENGTIHRSNESAQRLLGNDRLAGEDICSYLPVLARPLAMRQAPLALRTKVECRGTRRDGESFLAHIWFSTFETTEGRSLAAFVSDASENLREREGAGLANMMDTSRILVGALSHEVGNLAKSAIVACDNLARIQGVARSKDYQALGTIVNALEKISCAGLRVTSERDSAVTNLYTVLDEAMIVIGPAFEEMDVEVNFKVPAELPLVHADHHCLLQVFLNLANNSRRAMRNADRKQLTVEASQDGTLVLVRFKDTGHGVSDPDVLFRPFQPGASANGLGLYVSRALLSSNGGDLRYESGTSGSCFVVELPAVHNGADSAQP